MNRTLFALSLVLLASGAVLATGAFTAGDAIDPDGGLYLNPVDSEHGEEYAGFDENNELVIAVEVPPHSTTIVDDVFAVHFADFHTTGNATEVWFTPDNDELVTIYRMDTREPVHEPDSAIVLEPDESVVLGLQFDTGDPGLKDEEMTIRANTPAADPGPDPDPDPDPDPGPDPEPDPGPDPDPDPGPEPEPDPSPDPGEIPSPVPPATPDPGLFPGPFPDVDPPEIVGPPEEPGEPEEIEPVEDDELVIPGLGGIPVDFGTFVAPWYAWLVLFAVLTTTVDYLTQTQLRRRVFGLEGVLPLLQTPKETRKQRMVYALSRLGLLWLTVLVLALVAMAALWTVGLREWALFVTILVASIVLGLVLGYFRLPDIEGDYVDGEDDTGTAATSSQIPGDEQVSDEEVEEWFEANGGVAAGSDDDRDTEDEEGGDGKPRT